jgi:DNA processing protein
MEKEAQNLICGRSEINLDQELEKLQREQIQVVTMDDKNYPKLLKEIYDPPFVLYYRGNINFLNDQPCISVVGARKHTAYGEQAAKDIVKPLAEQGMVIVSGLALGIDALAHQAALDGCGATAAVLGSDLSWKNIGPKTNHYLAKQILDSGGAIISEFPLGAPTFAGNFPMRNRIVSGLSIATLIIEAGEKSGTLITAASALEQGRDVYAVPGSIYSSRSTGTNSFIKKGAKAVTCANDILEELQLTKLIKKSPNSELKPGTPEEEKIISALINGSLHIDKLAQICNVSINALSGIVMIMEINGLIKDVGGSNYVSLIK